jgi:hypothetical protein
LGFAPKSPIYLVFQLILLIALAPNASATPEIVVSGNTLSINDGDQSPRVEDFTTFVQTSVGAGFRRRFFIQNSGSSKLSLSGSSLIAITGGDAEHFTVATQPSPCLPAGAGTSFEIEFSPESSGLKEVDIEIVNNDSDESVFTFRVEANGFDTKPWITKIETGSLMVGEGEAPKAISSIIELNDSDSAQLNGATVAIIEGYERGVDVLSYADSLVAEANGISASFNSQTGVLTLSGMASVENYQEALRSVLFAVQGAGIRTSERTIEFRISDGTTSSEPLVRTLAVSADTDGDGESDATDLDDDNDGLSDTEEDALGADPLNPDSDGDGVDDGQEVDDGSDPNDNGSNIPILSTELCAEWNGFFDGSMFNILEHVNQSSQTRNLTTTIYSFEGEAQGTLRTSVLSGAQTDVLAHGIDGWTVNSYGRVCTQTNGAAGDVAGRMVFYRPREATYDFAFSMEFTDGIEGDLYVLFNTYQPSLDIADANNFVANWVQLTNRTEQTQEGRIRYLAQDGTELGSERVTIPGNARRDFAGHQFGSSLVGLIVWEPDDENAPFVMRNVRYLYDNPGAVSSFDSALQLVGSKPSGRLLTAPLDTTDGTAVLEIANAQTVDVSVEVNIYDAAGSTVFSETLLLAPKQSRHIIADPVLPGQIGSATVKGNRTDSVLATAMHYGRTPSAGVRYIYGIPFKESLGTVLRGSYNTFLGQGCFLYLKNILSTENKVSLMLVRETGEQVFVGEETLSGSGTARVDLCALSVADAYGTLTLQSDTTNSIVAHVVRLGPQDAYRFVTAVRQ